MTPSPADALADARAAFDAWRATRRRGDPIPDELWARAVTLLDEIPLGSVSYQLRLNAERLRTHATAAGRIDRSAEKVPSLGFLELPPGALSAPTTPHAAARGRPHPGTDAVSLEVERADGSRLSIAIPGADCAHAEALLVAFLRA